jgi:hypothetical protein
VLLRLDAHMRALFSSLSDSGSNEASGRQFPAACMLTLCTTRAAADHGATHLRIRGAPKGALPQGATFGAAWPAAGAYAGATAGGSGAAGTAIAPRQ